MQKIAQDLAFGDLVIFEGKTHRIIDVVPLNMGLFAIGLAPTNRHKPEFKFLTPRSFHFNVISS